MEITKLDFYLFVTDFNECSDFFNDCPVNASCVNSDGSYACRCPIGFRLEGKIAQVCQIINFHLEETIV